MIKKWIKDITVWFKLQFITNYALSNKDLRSTNSDMTTVDVGIKPIVNGIEKDQDWWHKKNNLLEYFDDILVVYEPDMTTIRKENQYGYINPQPELENPTLKELLDNDVEFIKTEEGYMKPIVRQSKAAIYQTKKQAFEERWEKIKKAARSEKHDENSDEMEINAIIKE